MLINWDVHRWETNFAFDNLKDYLELVESQFETVRELERNRTNFAPPPGMSECEYLEWYDDYKAEVMFFEDRYERDFPSKIRYSFIVLLHIVLEERLSATCKEIVKRKGLAVAEKYSKGAALERAKTFLIEVAAINFDKQGWQELKDFQMIRNCIVHTNGRIEESRDKKRISDLCKRGKGISDTDGFLRIEKTFCDRTLQSMSVFFKNLLDSTGFGSCQITMEESETNMQS